MKTNKNNFLIAIIISLIFQFQSFGLEYGKVEIGTKYKMKSTILKETRYYIVNLPQSYDKSSRAYPVLILLDGGSSNFHFASGMINQMNQGRQIPEMIIVGLFNTDRVRDFTPTNSLISLNGSEAPYQKTSGGSESFLNFIEKELLVEIDERYRTNSFKVLVGHSHGGLVVGSSYLSNDSSFDAYLSIDPSFWWDNGVIVNMIDGANIEHIKNKTFYLSTADNYENWNSIGANRNSQELFFATLKNKKILPPNLKFDYFEKENHWTTPTPSLYNGLQFIYKDFYMKDFWTTSVKDIVDHYNNNFNGKFSPPEANIDMLAYYYLREGEWQGDDKEKALKLFQLNVSNYEDSDKAYSGLGEAYKVIGDKKLALKNYRKSLKLNHNNQKAKDAIKELEK